MLNFYCQKQKNHLISIAKATKVYSTVVAKSLATLENLLEKSKKLIKFGLMEYN